MRTLRYSSLLFLVLLSACASRPKEPISLAPQTFNYVALLGDPPAEGSPEHLREIDTMLKLQGQRVQEDIERCELEVHGTPIGFAARAMGGWFNENDFPVTAALLQEVTADTRAISDEAKTHWKRPRPHLADPRIIPCVLPERTFSYPSGHATRGIVWATVLSEICPDHRTELMAAGRQYGHDRVLAGVHYPSDVAAGQKLGAEIAHRMIINPDFQKKVKRARSELVAAAARS